MSLLLLTACVASHTCPLTIKWPLEWQRHNDEDFLFLCGDDKPLRQADDWVTAGPASGLPLLGERLSAARPGPSAAAQATGWEDALAGEQGRSCGTSWLVSWFHHGPEGPVIDVPSQGSCVELPRPCLQEPGGDLWPMVLSSHVHAIRQFHWSGWTFLLLWLSV